MDASGFDKTSACARFRSALRSQKTWTRQGKEQESAETDRMTSYLLELKRGGRKNCRRASHQFAAFEPAVSFSRYFAGSLSNFGLQWSQQSRTSVPSWTNTKGAPITPSFSPETTQVVRGYSAAKASPAAMNRKKSDFFIRYFLLLKLVRGTDDTWRLP